MNDRPPLTRDEILARIVNRVFDTLTDDERARLLVYFRQAYARWLAAEYDYLAEGRLQSDGSLFPP